MTQPILMKCPKCAGRNLVATRIRETDVDRCESCGGVWFDETELGVLLKEDAKSLRPLRGGKEQEQLNETVKFLMKNKDYCGKCAFQALTVTANASSIVT